MPGAFMQIGQVAIREVASSEVYEKLVQDILHVNGKGVDESFVGERVGMASISIPRVALGEGGFRKLGASVNGGQFNAKAAVNPESDYIEVPLLFTYDRTETLARIMNDKAGYALLEQKTANIRRKIARGINALTFAVQLAEALNAEAKGSIEFTDMSASGGAKNAFIDANALLDEGDEELGVDYFPAENRQAFVTPAYHATLFKTGEVILNSEFGQTMLATGVLNPFRDSAASKVQMRNGYCGDLVGVPMYKVAPVLWKLATAYLDKGGAKLSEDALKGMQGFVCSSLGTIRGFSANDNIEVVPAISGQGWILQPLVHGGCKCISAKSVRVIVDNTEFTNPANGGTLTVLPPESR